MIVLDTAVLVYAVGTEHPLREPCRTVVAAATSGSVRATTTPEVIQEFAHVRSRRRPRDDAARLGRRYSELLAPLLVVDGKTLRAGLRLFERHPGLGCFDAVLAAAAIEAGASALVSPDTRFAEVAKLRTVDPAEPAALRVLLGSGG